jgi:NAD(P)-dependent dehydrogenase (short-subunit alcohol dehydrogenase family)
MSVILPKSRRRTLLGLGVGFGDSFIATAWFTLLVTEVATMTDENRAVIVTGSGGAGCGRSISTRFAIGGAAVIVSDIDEAGGHDTVRLIERSGGRATFFRADVRKESQVRDLVSFAETTFGGVSVLVNNASAPRGGEGIDSWMDPVETDLLGALYATRWAIEAMRRGGGGAIVNIASISALWHGRKTPGGIPGLRRRQGWHDPHDDQARTVGGDGWHSCELSGAWLDRDRQRAAVLGIADVSRACRTQRAIPVAHHRSDLGSRRAPRRRPLIGRTRARLVV